MAGSEQPHNAVVRQMPEDPLRPDGVVRASWRDKLSQAGQREVKPRRVVTQRCARSLQQRSAHLDEVDPLENLEEHATTHAARARAQAKRE